MSPTARGLSADRPGGRRAWIITGMLLILMMINFADKAVLGLAHDELLADLGLTESQYGTVSGGFFLLFAVTSVAVGFLADRFPAKSLLLWMAVLWTVSVVPLLGAAGFGILLASRVLLGAAEGPTFGVANHAVQKWFHDKDRNLPAAILTTGATLGVIIAAPALTWVIGAYGWRAAFASLGVIGLVWAVVWAFVGKEGPVGTAADGDAEEASRLTGATVPLRKLLFSGTYLGALAASAAAYVSLSLLLTYLPTYLKGALDYSDRTASLLYTLPWIVAAVLVMAQGVVTRKLMVRGVSTRVARGVLGGASLLVSAAFTILFLHFTSGVVQIVCMAFAFSVSGLIFAISTTVCGELAPPSQRGAVLGIYVAVASLAGVIAPIITGRLIDAASSATAGYDAGFTLMAVAMALGGLVAMALIRPERDAERLLAGVRRRDSDDTAPAVAGS